MIWTMALALTTAQVVPAATLTSAPPATTSPAASPAPGQDADPTMKPDPGPTDATLVRGEPSKQAVELGVRVARSGSLAAIAPLLADRDVATVVAAHPEWSADDVAIYRTTSRRVAEAGIARLVRALGRAYARRLSIADLERLATALEGPTATRRRAIEAPALVEALRTVGAIDFKRDTLAAFCVQMGKGCPTK